MTIEQADFGKGFVGFVIVRGKGMYNKQYFGFFVDSDKTSWSKDRLNARLYTSHGDAESELDEIKRRNRERKQQ